MARPIAGTPLQRVLNTLEKNPEYKGDDTQIDRRIVEEILDIPHDELVERVYSEGPVELLERLKRLCQEEKILYNTTRAAPRFQAFEHTTDRLLAAVESDEQVDEPSRESIEFLQKYIHASFPDEFLAPMKILHSLEEATLVNLAQKYPQIDDVKSLFAHVETTNRATHRVLNIVLEGNPELRDEIVSYEAAQQNPAHVNVENITRIIEGHGFPVHNRALFDWRQSTIPRKSDSIGINIASVSQNVQAFELVYMMASILEDRGYDQGDVLHILLNSAESMGGVTQMSNVDVPISAGNNLEDFLKRCEEISERLAVKDGRFNLSTKVMSANGVIPRSGGGCPLRHQYNPANPEPIVRLSDYCLEKYGADTGIVVAKNETHTRVNGGALLITQAILAAEMSGLLSPEGDGINAVIHEHITRNKETT